MRQLEYALLVTMVFASFTAQAAVVTAGGQDVRTISVTTEGELRAAIARVARENVTIRLDRRIVLYETVELGDHRFVRGISTPKSDNVLQIIGTTDAAEIDFNMSWSGDWAYWDELDKVYTMNGLSISTQAFLTQGVHYSNYNWEGNAIKFQDGHTENARFDRCRFENIGSATYPIRGYQREVKDSRETWCPGSAIGGVAENVLITGCTFQGIGIGSLWGHVIYLAGPAEHVQIVGNTFEHCGTVFRLSAGKSPISKLMIRGNTFDKPHRFVHHRYSRFADPWILDFHNDTQLTFSENVIRGQYDLVYLGGVNPEKHTFEDNDFSGFAYTQDCDSAWFGKSVFVMDRNKRPVEQTWEQWRASGMDEGSKPPGKGE